MTIFGSIVQSILSFLIGYFNNRGLHLANGFTHILVPISSGKMQKGVAKFVLVINLSSFIFQKKHEYFNVACFCSIKRRCFKKFISGPRIKTS